MAGRRQHFIPKFLQKGFIANKKHQTYFYSKSKNKAILTKIDKIGLQRDFYSNPEATHLDDIITDLESKKLSPFIEHLRNIKSDTLIEAKKTAALVHHLTVRTKYIRDFFDKSTSSIMNRFEKLLFEENSQEDVMKKFIGTDMLRESLRKSFIENGLEPNEIFINYLSHTFINQPQNFQHILTNTFKTMENFFKEFSNRQASMIEKAHKRQLINILKSQEPTPDKYFDYKWYLKICPEGSLVLSDNLAMKYNIEDDKANPPFFAGKNTYEQIYMPISHDRLLIGFRNEEYILEAQKINNHMISISNDFFIANIHTENYEKQINCIGNALEKQIQVEVSKLSLD